MRGILNFYRLKSRRHGSRHGVACCGVCCYAPISWQDTCPCITLLLGTSPLFVSNFNRLLSEFLFLFLFMLAIWLVLPSKGGVSNSIWRSLLGILLIAVSLHVRVVGCILLPGLFILVAGTLLVLGD